MNMRFIAMISSVAVLVSATSSLGTDTHTSPVTGNLGITASTDLSSKITAQTTAPSFISSTSPATTSNLTQSQNTLPSTSATLTTLTSVNTPNKPNNMNNTNSTNHNNQTNNTPSTSNVHIPIINSTPHMNGSGKITPQVPSVTTAPVNVPVTTVQQTTAFECNCSKYLQTSTTSASKQTPTTQKTTVASTTQKTTVAPTTQKTTVAPTTQKTTVAPTTQKTTVALTTQKTTVSQRTPKSTVAPTKQKTTVAPTTQKTTVVSTTQKNTVAPTTQKTTVASTTQKITVTPTTQKTTVASTTQKITVTPTTKKSTIAPTTQKTTVSPTTQKSTVAPTTQKTTFAPTTQTTTVAPTTQKTTVASTTQKNTVTPTTKKTTVSPTNTTPILVTKNPATTPATHSNRRRRGVVNIEIDEIQSEEQIILYDDTSSHDLYCMNFCNITMNETTPVPALTTTTERPTTTTPKPTTTTPRHRSIDIHGKLVDLNLVIVVKPDLANQSSSVYTNLANQYEISLTEFYKSLLHSKLRKIVIHGFSNGSIRCNFSLEMNAPINESDANSTLQILRNVNWKNASITNLTLDVNKTATAQAVCLADDLVFLPANVCVNNEVLEWDNDGNPICKYKCDTPVYKGKCGDHGECSFTYGGAFRCICKDGYSGNKCEPPKPTTTTAKPIKPDAIALSKIDIIGIAGGIGGGLVLILLIALCCVYTKLNKAKKRDRFYGYMDNDKEFLHDENSRIENVPDLKNEYTNLGYQREQDELQMQRFEPEGKNVDYEPGQPQGAYERDDKAYRKVEEPEGGNVLIYQPKHLNGPMERQSGASKFDEVEERSNPYRMMDTDTTYKIRRPTVNSDRNVPYN